MKGYIMATRRWTNTNYKFFCPSRAEVFIAEDLFRKYIDTFCRKTRANDTIVKDQEIASFKTCDCIALKFEIKKYFRQYTGWTENGIRYIYFECLAPELQKNEDLKKQWSFICDGGTILFHITVNLNTGNVEVSDNGVG